MLEHVLIGDAAPALILLAVRGPLLAFVLPAAAIRFATRRRGVSRVLAGLSRPAVAVCIWAVAIASWHVPFAYDAALRHPWLHVLEHATFVAAGFLVWAQLIDPARRGRLSAGGRAALAGALFMLGQAMAGVLLLSPVALYPFYADRPARLFGIAPLADQQYAALIMMAEQFLTLGTFLIILGASVLRAAEPRRFARRVADETCAYCGEPVGPDPCAPRLPGVICGSHRARSASKSMSPPETDRGRPQGPGRTASGDGG